MSRMTHVYRIGRAIRDIVIKAFFAFVIIILLAGTEVNFNVARIKDRMDTFDHILRIVQVGKNAVKTLK